MPASAVRRGGCVKGGVHLHVAVAVKVHEHDYDHDHGYDYVPAAIHRQPQRRLAPRLVPSARRASSLLPVRPSLLDVQRRLLAASAAPGARR